MKDYKDRKEKNKKIKEGANGVLDFILTFFLTLFIVIAVSLALLRMFSISVFDIQSGSMAPEYKVHTLVLAQKTDPNEIKVGDVITFSVGANTTPVTHRVVSIDKGERTFTTKGDANDENDPKPVSWDNLIGKVIFKIPMFGYAVQFITNGSTRIYIVIFLVTLALIAVIYEIYKRIRERKENKESDTEESIEEKLEAAKQNVAQLQLELDEMRGSNDLEQSFPDKEENDDAFETIDISSDGGQDQHLIEETGGIHIEEQHEKELEEERKRQEEERYRKELEEERKRQIEEQRRKELEEERKRQEEERYRKELEEERKRQIEEKRRKELEEERQRQIEEQKQKELEEENRRQIEEQRQREIVQFSRRRIEERNNYDIEQENSNVSQRKGISSSSGRHSGTGYGAKYADKAVKKRKYSSDTDGNLNDAYGKKRKSSGGRHFK